MRRVDRRRARTAAFTREGLPVARENVVGDVRGWLSGRLHHRGRGSPVSRRRRRGTRRRVRPDYVVGIVGIVDAAAVRRAVLKLGHRLGQCRSGVALGGGDQATPVNRSARWCRCIVRRASVVAGRGRGSTLLLLRVVRDAAAARYATARTVHRAASRIDRIRAALRWRPTDTVGARWVSAQVCQRPRHGVLLVLHITCAGARWAGLVELVRRANGRRDGRRWHVAKGLSRATPKC